MCVHRLACEREITPQKMPTTIITIVFSHLAIQHLSNTPKVSMVYRLINHTGC